MYALLKDDDLTPDQTRTILMTAEQHAVNGDDSDVLSGRSVLLFFLERSTRTQASLNVAINSLGGSAVLLDDARSRVADGETIADTARVMGQYVDIAFVRADQSDLDAFAEGFCGTTVNAGSDRWHPTQILADLLTLEQQFGTLAGLTLGYVGDGNDICNSVILGCCALGLHIRVATPDAHAPHAEAVECARRACRSSRGSLTLLTDPVEAVTGAHAVYTDTWRPMRPDDADERSARFAMLGTYQVNAELFGHARSDAVFLHCLPARREEEVTSEILDSPASAVLRQARNRLLVNKALLRLLPEFARE